MASLDRARLRRLPWEARYRLGRRVASEARRVLVELTHRHCRVEFQGPVYLGPGFALDIPGPGSFLVGPGVEFRRGFVCEISGGGRVSIGPGCSFTSNVLVQCSTSIDIGARCAFGQSVILVDGSHRFRDPSVPFLAQGYDFRPIVIGDDVAVMSKCTVLNSIGDHAFVGANSVVTRPIPAYCLAVGAPARVVEYFGPPELRPEGLELGEAGAASPEPAQRGRGAGSWADGPSAVQGRGSVDPAEPRRPPAR
jgi:acetyltransferase-like isoleucine patch superfamily enzyme